jgi:cytochrome c556
MHHLKSSTLIVVACALLAVSIAAQQQQQPTPPQQPAGQQPAAQQEQQGRGGRGRGGEPGAPGTPAAPGAPAKPYVPLAASTLADHPDTYYGELVTVTGAVEQSLSKLAFSVDQDKTKSTGKDVIVVAPTLMEPVALNTYVTVIGEVVHLDPAEIGKKGADVTKEYKLDVAADVIEKYKGHPVVVAKSVITTAGVDVAKRPPPPMTAEEEALSKIMKQIGPANTALRGALDKTDMTAAKENATVLKQAFVQTEAFWKPKGKPEAIKFAEEARKLSEQINAAIGTGNWDEAKTHAGTLGQQCAGCHGAFRERMDDGTYRIKNTGGSSR